MSSIMRDSPSPNRGNLKCPETYIIKAHQILPYLLDMDFETIKKGVKPSVLEAALSLETEERLEKLRSPLRKYRVASRRDAFSRCPEAIIFQNFKTGDTYTATLTVTNQRTIPQNLKIQFEPTRFFSLAESSRVSKLAPGMTCILNINFLPIDRYRDYVHEISFSSPDSCFSVPIFALGPRPLVFLPDKVILPPTLVKVESTKVIVMKNKGIVPLAYSAVPSKTFSCENSKAIVPPNGILDMKFGCYPLKPGHTTGTVDVFYRDDLFVTVETECDVSSIKIQLHPRIISFEDIYMGLCSRQVLTVENPSEYTLNFAWKMSDQEEEIQQIAKLVQLMSDMKEYEQKRYEKLEYMDIIDGQGHADIYERIFQDEKHDLETKQQFLYKSEFFDMIPKVGKVLPKTNFEFSIVFTPRQNIFYNSTAYLDIEGTEKRIRVSLQGNGIGPPVMLSVKNLDAGQIYLTDKHQYELAVMNKGVIPATVRYLKKKTDFGGILTCVPECLGLGPDGTKAFLVVFYSEIQGEFVETIEFEVEESGERLQFIFCGNVICPLLKCIPEVLNFGTVSVGVSNTRILQLVNESRVSIRYELEFEDHFKEKGETNITIVPRYGKVDAHGHIDVKIIFSCDISSGWETNLLLVMWNSRLYTTKIPFRCTCSSPKITCEPKVVGIKFCFLNCEYIRTIKLMNQSDLPGCIEYASPQDSNYSSIICIPSRKKISFGAHETIELELKISVTELGAHELPLIFSIIGDKFQKLCTISCNGQGPVVSYNPDEMNFGRIDVLGRYEQKLTLVNDSPILAKVRVYSKPNSSFHVEDGEYAAELMPEEQTDVTVWAVLNNPGITKDTIYVNIYQGDLCSIRAYAEGVGTSILCEPQLTPSIHLGTILTYNTFTQEVKITNKGNLHHKLMFTKRHKVRSLKEDPEDRAPSIFTITPRYLEMHPNEKTTISIKGISKKPKTASEHYYCHALIGKSALIHTIHTFTVEAEFVDPKLNFSTRNVDFNLEVIGNVAEGKFQDVICMDNETGIPVQVFITMEAGNDTFTIAEKKESVEKLTKLAQDIGGNSMLSVHFHPTITGKRRCSQKARLIFEYENHPKTDIINLHGQVMFPTVKFNSQEVNFRCVPLGSTSSKHVILQNISEMVVHFKWFWLEKSVQISKLTPVRDYSRSIKLAEDAICSNEFMQYTDIKVIDQDITVISSDLKQSLSSDRYLSFGSEFARFVYSPNKYLGEMKTVLYSLLSPYKREKNDELVANIAKRTCMSESRITKMFSLEPSEGVLQPNEYTIVTVGFCPPPNTEVMATAICKVRDGAEEALFVKGKSSKQSYKLDKYSVNYGNQVFCETCTDQLTLSNNGLCSIDFKVIVEEPLGTQAELLDVNPRNGTLSPGSSITFKIDYFAGYPGYFEKSIIFEVGYLEPVTVSVQGYAVLNQIFLHIARPDMQLDTSDCYKAVAWITPEYLELVQGDENGKVDDEPVDPRKFLEENDWVYISYNDSYPSLMDINMAMERIAAFNLITKYPRLLSAHTVTKKELCIPQFFPPPYCVDFGYVVRDLPVCYTVIISNYGPRNAEFKLLEDNKTALLEKEIKIEFRPKVLSPGEIIELYVIFSPTKRSCSILNTKVEDVFRLSVRHGPTITVQIKAEVTLPVVSLQHEELYFERVYCGDALRKTVVLTNNGNVQSKWLATIGKPTKKGEVKGFFVIPSQGVLEPGRKMYIDIYFVPTNTYRIKRTLRIDVESNAQPVFMELIGEGLESTLMIVPAELNFSPTLSYFETSLCFAVQNMAEIPMEFYFPTFDCETEHEKLLLRVYLKYKNLKQVFIPLRAAGVSLPDFFANTYMKLIEKLRNKMMNMSIEENSNGDEAGNEAEEEAVEVKPIKNLENEDPLAKYSSNELNSLLIDYITAEGFENDCPTDTTTYRVDDSSDIIEIVEPTPKVLPEDVERKGVLFILHGAPNTDYYRAANLIGIALSIPVYSIDRLIIESLVENIHPAAAEILNTIDRKISELQGSVSNASLWESLESENSEYDRILDKVTTILTSKPKKVAKKTTIKEKESKGSSEKSQGKPKDKGGAVGDTFLNISPDLLVDLLRPKMKGFSRLVLESVNSIFITVHNLALYTVLRAAGALEYINLIIFSFTIADIVKNEEKKLELSPRKTNSGKPEPDSPKKSKQATKGPGKSSTKAGSETVSKTSSRPGKSGDAVKKALHNLSKTMKAELEEFENLRNEIYHITLYWDKRSTALRKPYSASGSSKRDGGGKDGARTNRISVKKTSISQNSSDIPESGVNLWLILNSSKERQVDFAETIRNCVSEDAEIEMVLNEIEEDQKEKFKESQTSFTVISKPSSSKNDQSSAFMIKNFQSRENIFPVRTRSKSGSSLKIKKKRSSKSSRKSAESKPGTDTIVAFTKADHETDFFSKMVLHPGDLTKYQVTFCPRKCGTYKYAYSIETLRTKQPYKIQCRGVCEFPRVDLNPEVMFPRTLDNYREKASYDHFVFIKDQKILDFGSIIVGSHPEKCLVYSTTVLLKNISSSLCDIVLSLSNDIFTIEPSRFLIAPKDEDVVRISVKSTKIGTLTAQLYITIKNNPKVEEFTLACSPCKLEFSIYPRTISFDKVPLNYSARRVVRLTNTSPINLRWELVEPAWASEIFDISQESGHMGLYSVCDIIFRFHPEEELYFPKRHLQIKVYDVSSSGTEPCFTENISIHADSVEYNLEVASHIDYGDIKGGVDHKRHFAITNKGKCDVILKIETINNPLEAHNFIREYFKVHPLLLTVGALKTQNLLTNFRPKSNFSVSHLLIFVVSMVESMQTGHVVKSYRVTLSATSFMPSYKLCPQSHVNFGYVPLLSSKTLKLEVTNQGKFPFSFAIHNYAKKIDSHHSKGTGSKKGTAVDITGKKGKKADKEGKSSGKLSDTVNKSDKKEKSDKGSKKKSGTSKTSKGTGSKSDKKKAMKITKLEVGGFNITPSSGIVEPNEKFLIELELTANEIKEYKEQILLNIAEIDDPQKRKVIGLKAIGCEPKLNLKDFDSIFMEQYCVTQIDDFVLPRNVDGCCVFASKDVSLYFKLVCINTSYTTKLYFKNIGYVTSYLAAKLDESGKSVFSVAPPNKVLEPHSTHFLEVTFKPNHLEEVSGILEISYNASTDNKLTIQLYGQAGLPQIQLLKPLPENSEASLDIGPVCVGFTKKERMIFKNVGQIKCKVIVEMAGCDSSLYFVPCSNTVKTLNVQDEDCIKDMKRHIIVNLLLDEIAEFDIVYDPVKQERCKSVLNLHTVYNPYETFKILIEANSFDNDIILEGLEPLKLNEAETTNTELVTKNSIGYLLDLGYKELNKLCKTTFLIRNRSNNDIYKFRFYCSSVSFIPEVGHLKPGATKDVLVLFKATSPILLEREEITCNVNTIQYVTPNPDPLSWDDRQKLVYWVYDRSRSISSPESAMLSLEGGLNLDRGSENESKRSIVGGRTRVIVEGGEPDIITIPDSMNIIPLYLTVAADYARFECETDVIDFADTYVKEESREEFTVKNNGIVPLNITWTVIDRNSSCSDVQRSCSETSIAQNIIVEDISLKSAKSTSGLFSSSPPTLRKLVVPITIIPEKTIIDPGQNATFNVLFTPQEENDFEAFLESHIEVLDPNMGEMKIEVNAKALSIPFYFEMEDGSSSSKDMNVDFENVGVATESVRKILLVNPNEDDISFEIIPKNKKEFSYFVCDTPKGKINKHKKYIAIFSFRPPIFGSFKELYTIRIPEKDVEKTISLKGLCREPNVYFAETHIILRPTVPKVKTSKSLKLRNDETFPISFKFMKKSLFSETQQEKLEAYPIVGKLKPQSETDIMITFKATHPISTIFHVKCFVEKLKAPLSLHVEARCMNIQSSVRFTNLIGEVILLKENEVNVIDLGQTYKSRKDIIQFEISNEGKTGMFYTWEFDNKPIEHLFKISVDTVKEFIKSNQTVIVKLNVLPIRTATLKDFKINLNILYGPIYTIHLNAVSDKPCYTFSFDAYNFGYCLTQNGDSNYYNTMLSFKNLDNKKILLENLFEQTDYLSVDFSSRLVPPGETRNIPIKFHPQKVGVYKEEVLFSVGSSKHMILITGEAVSIKLELSNPKDKFINFGEVVVHSLKKYRVGVHNNSPARLDVHFDLFDNLVIHRRKVEKLEKDKMKIPALPPPPKEEKKEKPGKKGQKAKEDKPKDNKSKSDKKSDKDKAKKEEERQTEERLAAEDLLRIQAEERQAYLKCFTIVPNMFIDIAPRGQSYFDITFQPNKKMSFEEKIYFETQDHIEPLCVIKGSSIVPEFSLDKKEVLFTGVIVGCNSTQLITLKNTGDIIGSFSWKAEDKQTVFNIEPKQGFVLPKNDMKIKVTFSPKEEKCHFKQKVKCSIKEFKDILELTLKGNSVNMPEPRAKILMECNVREKVVDHSVVVANNTSEQWLLHTEISHEAFSAPRDIIALPFSSTQVPITYTPKRIALTKPDEAKLFIKIPDGSGLLYSIIGKASPPAMKKRIEKEIHCKQNFYEIIPVENWLATKQTFNVITEVISPITTKTLYKIFGFKTIELYANELKNYKWGVYVVNEGSIEFRITFKNRDTEEYEFFEVCLKVLPSEPVETVIFNTRVREPKTKLMTLKNPIDVPITYILESTERNLQFPRAVSMEPYTTAKIDVTYTPLQVETTSDSITARCEEMGTFTYIVKMHAEPPKSEDHITFTCELGSKATKTIFFKNIFDKTVEFSYKFSNRQFHMERCGSILPGESSKIAIAFEPTRLGHTKSKLFLASAVAGEYTYTIHSEGILPTPKGPFTVGTNYPAAIEFRNPFDQDREFRFKIYPDRFYCDFDEDVIRANKTVRFLIGVRPALDAEPSCFVTGKLVIYSPEVPEIEWKYCLQYGRQSH